MVLVLFGPPGSGKGTQAQYLVWEEGFEHISTGDLLRHEIERESSLGQEIGGTLAAGQFVPGDVMANLIEGQLSLLEEKNIIFDGYPRTLTQAIDFDRILALKQRKVDLVIDLAVDQEVLLSRLTGRFRCKICGALYHEVSRRPLVETICDRCGATEFVKRDDDKADVAMERLKVYERETAPVRDYYITQGKLRKVDATQDVDVVRMQIKSLITGQKNLV